MISAIWKLKGVICFHLAVLLFLATSCQPIPVNTSNTPVASEPPPILLPSFTSIPPPAPSRVELLAQLTIGKINRMGVSPDGDYLAVAAASGLYLYQEPTLELVWGSATSGGVTQVIWSTDGSRLGGVIGHNTLVAWDAYTGNMIRSLETQTDYVTSLHWLPSGDRLTWLGSDTHLHIWNPDKDSLVEINTASVMDEGMAEGGPASYSPDASLVAISGWKYLTDGDVTIGRSRPLIMMDAAIGRTLYTLEDVGFYSFVTFSPDGSLLITGSSVRNPSNGEILWTLEGYPDSGLDFAFSPDGMMFSVEAYDGSPRHKIYIWDITTGNLLNMLNVIVGHKDSYPITSMTWSPDGSRIMTSALDKTVVVWNAKTGELLRKITGIPADVIQAEFSADGNIIYVLSEDAHIVAWDILTGNPLREIQSVANISKLAWTVDSASLAASSVIDGGLVNNVYIWDATEGKMQSILAGPGFPRNLQFSPDRSSDQRIISSDGRMMASVKPYSGQLDVSHVLTNEKLFSAPVYAFAGMSIAWSPVQPVLSVADGTARILIWNAETGETSELTAKNKKFWKVSWSIDGSLLATSSESNILIWNTSTWSLFQTLDGYGAVNQLAFSPDGKLLATGSWDGVVSLWELIP